MLLLLLLVVLTIATFLGGIFLGTWLLTGHRDGFLVDRWLEDAAHPVSWGVGMLVSLILWHILS